jgi:hypothetical protein
VVLDHYEEQLLTFTAGAAKVKTARTASALRALEAIEKRLFDPQRIAQAGTRDLIKLYGTASAAAAEGLAFIEKVIKLRPELERLSATPVTPEVVIEKDDDDLPELTAAERQRLRLLLDAPA